jgi:hypothetical protein
MDHCTERNKEARERWETAGNTAGNSKDVKCLYLML